MKKNLLFLFLTLPVLLFCAELALPEVSMSPFELRLVRDWEPNTTIKLFSDNLGTEFVLSNKPEIDSSDVGRIIVALADKDSESNSLFIELDDEGAKKLRKITQDNLGQRLAILCLGDVVAAPKIMVVIEGGIVRIPSCPVDVQIALITALMTSRK